MNPIYQYFLDLLRKAQKLRPQKSKWIENELEWMVYERKVMFNGVNQERIRKGLTPITLEELMRIESLASGHSDYTSKFALYCAELAEGRGVTVY